MQLASKRHSSIYRGVKKKTTEHNDQQRLAIKQSVTQVGEQHEEKEKCLKRRNIPRASLEVWSIVYMMRGFSTVPFYHRNRRWKRRTRQQPITGKSKTS